MNPSAHIDESRDPRGTLPEAASPETTIHRLPTALINQIAAGEVVTRPADALKELIENSLDAGASRIEITVADDARGFSVCDDGRGMSRADLELSVERHATSKISVFDDLHRLTTRGFRGEALAAIAAVSRLEILTRRLDDPEALRLRASGGVNPRVNVCGANVGTTIHVRDLFYNTPARVKFLKSAVAEWGQMLKAIVRQALTCPDVAFAIRWRGKPYMDLPAGQSLINRLSQILPSDAGTELLPIDHTLGEVRVHGAVTRPTQTRRDRRHQYYFVNGRPIVFRPLQFALEEAYRGLIMTQRFPMGAAMLELPGEMIDVNVHPTKEQVRFLNEALVSGAIHRAALEALRDADLVPRLQTPTPGANLQGAIPRSTKRTPPSAPPLAMTPDNAPPASANPKDDSQQLDFVPGWGIDGAKGSQPPAAATPHPAASQETGPEKPPYKDPAAGEEAHLIGRLRATTEPPRVLSQIDRTYILADAGESGLLVIDQHAAHEKILYLKMMEQAGAGRGAIAVQPLMIPHSIEISPSEAPLLEQLLPALAEVGFTVEPFGDHTFIVQALPVVFEGLNVEAFVRDLIDDVGQGDLPREMRRLSERICARAACRAATMSGDRLSREEMEKLLADVMMTERATRCPHGRPTMILLTRDALDRQFGRLG